MVYSDDEDVTEVDRARLLDSYSEPEPEPPDPAAARTGIAPYLEDIHSYMLSLEVRVSRVLFKSLPIVQKFVLAVDLPGLEFTNLVVLLWRAYSVGLLR